MKRILTGFTMIASLAVLLFSLHSVVLAADSTEQPERYKRDFAFRDFRTNQDAMRYEIPENGAYKIMPRLKNTAIWTQFQIPTTEQPKIEWSVKAVVRSSEGSAAGVGLWMGNNGYCFYLYPDGKGSLQYYEGKKSTWRTSVEIKNFRYPASLRLRRDANGSILAEVDGMVAATRLLAIDVKEPKLSNVTSASFATHSPAAMPARGNTGVTYERLEVEGWGLKATEDRFEELIKN